METLKHFKQSKKIVIVVTAVKLTSLDSGKYHSEKQTLVPLPAK